MQKSFQFDPDLVYSRHADAATENSKPVEPAKCHSSYDVGALCLRVTTLTHELEEQTKQTLALKRELGFALQRLDRLESRRG